MWISGARLHRKKLVENKVCKREDKQANKNHKYKKCTDSIEKNKQDGNEKT